MPITFSCPSCGRELRVADSAAGKPGSCPHCQGTIQVPAATQAISAAPLAAPAGATLAAAPASGGSKQLLLLAAGAGVVVVALVVAAALLFRTSSTNLGEDLQYLPNQCYVVGTVRVIDLVGTPVYREMRAEAAKLDPDEDLDRQFQITMGLPITDASHLTFGAGQKDHFAMVLHTRRDVTPAELMKNMKTRFFQIPAVISQKPKAEWIPRKFKEIQIAGHTVHEEDGDFTHTAFCVVNPRTVVFSDLEPMRAILERKGTAEIPAGLQRALDQVNTSRPLVVAINFQDVLGTLQRDLAFGEMGNALNGVEAAAFEATFGQDVQAAAQVLCKDAAAADQVKKMAEGFIALAKISGQLPPDLAKTVNSIKFTTSGNRVAASGNLLPQALIAALGQQATTTFQTVGDKIEIKGGEKPPIDLKIEKDEEKK